MQDFIQIMLGDYSTGYFIGMFTFAILGAFLHSVKEISDRNIDSINTPTQFSLLFFIKDNFKKYVANIIALYLGVRLFVDMFGQDLTPYTAFLLGFSGDSIMSTIKRKSKTLQIDREKLMQKIDNN